jgi:hypothetical protein
VGAIRHFAITGEPYRCIVHGTAGRNHLGIDQLPLYRAPVADPAARPPRTPVGHGIPVDPQTIEAIPAKPEI